jgi:hypothetical protein
MRLVHPNVKGWRHFPDEGKLSMIKSIKKVPIATVVLIERPGFDGDAILGRLVD